jgi:hypothetical protein
MPPGESPAHECGKDGNNGPKPVLLCKSFLRRRLHAAMLNGFDHQPYSFKVQWQGHDY